MVDVDHVAKMLSEGKVVGVVRIFFSFPFFFDFFYLLISFSKKKRFMEDKKLVLVLLVTDLYWPTPTPWRQKTK